MRRRLIEISLLGVWTLWMVPAFAADAPVQDTHHWGIGLQGNFPLWGGLSVKYMGLGRLHLQALEHYVQNGDEYSAMIGVQTPIIAVRYPWTKVYIAPGAGFRKIREIQTHYIYPRVIPDATIPPVQPDRILRTVNETTTGAGLLFGVEFFLDNIFSSSENSRYGLNIEFGQGVGRVNREATCEDAAGKIVNCADYPDLQYLRDDPNEKEGTSSRASFVVGFGFHLYF